MCVQELKSFKAVGSPIDNKSSIFVEPSLVDPYASPVPIVTIDGEKRGSSFLGRTFLMEMLPGLHQIKIVNLPKKGTTFSGQFVAENSKYYYLIINKTKAYTRGSGYTETHVRIHGVSIVELPLGFNFADENQRMQLNKTSTIKEEDGSTWTLYGDNAFLRKCKTVAYLRNN